MDLGSHVYLRAGSERVPAKIIGWAPARGEWIVEVRATTSPTYRSRELVYVPDGSPNLMSRGA